MNPFLAWDYYLKRDYDRCLAVSQKAMQTFPGFWVPHLTAGMCYSTKAQYSQSIQEFQKARAMNSEATFALSGLGVAYAKSGDQTAARKIVQ